MFGFWSIILLFVFYLLHMFFIPVFPFLSSFGLFGYFWYSVLMYLFSFLLILFVKVFYVIAVGITKYFTFYSLFRINNLSLQVKYRNLTTI